MRSKFTIAMPAGSARGMYPVPAMCVGGGSARSRSSFAASARAASAAASSDSVSLLVAANLALQRFVQLAECADVLSEPAMRDFVGRETFAKELPCPTYFLGRPNR